MPYQLDAHALDTQPQNTSMPNASPAGPVSQATNQYPSQISQPTGAFGLWQDTSYPLPAPTAGPSIPTARTTTAYAEHGATHYRTRTERMHARVRTHMQGPGVQQNLATIEDIQYVEEGVYFLIFVPRANNNG